MGRFSDGKSKYRLAKVILVLFTFGSYASAEELLDRVVATVNGVPILHSEIQKKLSLGPIVTVSPYPSGAASPEKEQAINDSINLQLILKKSELLEIEVTETEVDTKIEEFFKANGLTKEQFLTFLEQKGQTWDEYRQDYKNLIIIRRFQGRVIRPLINITQKDIESYYIKHSGGSQDLVAMDLRQILIEIPSGATKEFKEEKQRLAEDIYYKLSGGMDFTQAAKLYSSNTGMGDDTGLMKGVKLKDLAGPIKQSLQSIKVGEFTKPVKTGLGFHIFYLESQSFLGGQDFEKIKARIENEITMKELGRQLEKWLENERSRSKVTLL